jgi:GNAT superfamily N-acetyltransferase
MSLLQGADERHALDLNNLTAVHFKEANADEQIECDKLAASAFGHPLSMSEFLEREECMREHTLAQQGGVRTWCLYNNTGICPILATCKTIRRELIVADAHGSRQQIGYCISSVVTHPDFRGRGCARMLLHKVAEWLDGPGDACASMLYSNKEEVSRFGYSYLIADLSEALYAMRVGCASESCDYTHCQPVRHPNVLPSIGQSRRI